MSRYGEIKDSYADIRPENWEENTIKYLISLIEQMKEAIMEDIELWDIALVIIDKTDREHNLIPYRVVHNPVGKLDKVLKLLEQ